MNSSAPPRRRNSAAPNPETLGRPKLIFLNRVFWPNEAATAQLLTDLATALAGCDWAVHVIASGTDGPTLAGVTIHRTGPGPAGRLARYAHYFIAARRTLLRLVAPGDIVVLKTDPPLLAIAATSLARSRGARVVQWIQDVYPEIVPLHVGAWARPLVAPLGWLRDRAWRASAACAIVSQDMHATLLAHGVAPERAHVLPNWAPRELDAPAPAADIAAVRADWGMRDEFLVVYSGNLGRVHEFETILDAARLLRDVPGIRFAFVGTGPRRTEVEAAARARGLSHVSFFPPQPRARLAAALAAADAHLVTLRPGFERLVAPSKLAGVLAAARPALFIGPRPSEIATLLEREGCGAAHPVGDAAGIAATLRGWQADPHRRAGLGRAARAAYERHYRFAELSARWDRLLRDLCLRE